MYDITSYHKNELIFSRSKDEGDDDDEDKDAEQEEDQDKRQCKKTCRLAKYYIIIASFVEIHT